MRVSALASISPYVTVTRDTSITTLRDAPVIVPGGTSTEAC